MTDIIALPANQNEPTQDQLFEALIHENKRMSSVILQQADVIARQHALLVEITEELKAAMIQLGEI